MFGLVQPTRDSRQIYNDDIEIDAEEKCSSRHPNLQVYKYIYIYIYDIIKSQKITIIINLSQALTSS